MEQTAPRRYRAFISYSHRDGSAARWLHSRLEGFRNPKKSATDRWPLSPVFLDRSEFSSGSNLSVALTDALETSDALIVVCSPDAAASTWVDAEILTFKRLGGGTAARPILPLIISGEPNSGDPETECFPRALRFELGVDNELSDEPAEPLAADARRSADGRRDAFLRLAAALLRVPFDSLRLRQQRRRARQAMFVSAGALAGLLLTTTLAVLAVQSREEAERRREQAEDMMSFMLGDLRSSLEPIGRLDLLDAVGDNVMQYFRVLPAQSTRESIKYALAMRQIGEVRVDQGRNAEGRAAFEEAQQLLEPLAVRDDQEGLFELGQVHFWIADTHYRDLQYDLAQPHIERYAEISEHLVVLAPENLDFQTELLFAHSNLGTLAIRTGDLVEADRRYAAALEIGRLVGRERTGPDSDRLLADTLSWLGAIALRRDDLTAAIARHEEEMSLRRSLTKDDEAAVLRYELAATLELLADVLMQSGFAERAADLQREAVAELDALVALDPTNFRWRRRAAWASAVLVDMGVAIDSPGMNARLNAMIEDLSAPEGEPDVATLRARAMLRVALARDALRNGETTEAGAHARKAREELEPLLRSEDSERVATVYGRAALLVAESATMDGDEVLARAEAGHALVVLESHAGPVALRARLAALAFIAGRADASKLRHAVIADGFASTVASTSALESWWGEASTAGMDR